MLNNLKRKVDDIDVGKLKTVPIDLTLSDAVNNNVVKKTKFNTLKNYSRCNYINSHKSIKHGKTNLGTKIGDVYKKVPHTSGLVTTTVVNTKISKLRIKFLVLVVQSRK